MSLTKKLRRIVLNQQGLLKTDPFGRSRAATLRAIEHLGYVQIDTISVVARAHHHVLRSRVPHYQPALLDQLIQQRKIFEYWFHAAAWLPMRDYRFALLRMAKKDGERNWYRNFDEKLNRYVLDRIRTEGPLLARDFATEGRGKTGWWDWNPRKAALEQLFMQGELMVSARPGFQKQYDLAERVLPSWVDRSLPDIAEFAAYLIDTGLRAQGLISQQSVTYLRKGQDLRQAVQQQLQQRLESKTLINIRLPDHSSYYIRPELLESRMPSCQPRVMILSPFDPALIQRQQCRTFFSYDYQLECYRPKSKRRFGYFCLPILYADTFVGHMDAKAHRAEKRFELKSLHIITEVDAAFAEIFYQALIEFAAFNACDHIIISATPTNALLRSLKHRCH